MKKKISELIQKQQFFPGLLGIFINPFYFARKELLRQIRSLSPKITGRVLDVGCGQKPYESVFSKAREYVGMEYDSPYNRKVSKAEFFYHGETFPFTDSAFDAVIITQVIEHIFNPDEFMREVRRVVKTNGQLLLTAPFVWDEHSQPHDYARYSSYGLRHLLTKHGFQIIEQRKTLPDIRTLFQLWNGYLFKKLRIRNYYARILTYILLISPFTITGLVLSPILPKNNDLYLDNIILAKKI